ncbi:MAG: hypothetical protein HOP08_02695 [Cyclobacteriaceae bacterium]|nr:hypothetical protein [Cyclobacteriaceae bacterium]
MSKVTPVHSVNPGSPQVYHDNDKCSERNNLERDNIRPGKAGRPLCPHCIALGVQGK